MVYHPRFFANYSMRYVQVLPVRWLLVLCLVYTINTPFVLILVTVAVATALVLPCTHARIAAKPWLKTTFLALVRLLGPVGTLATVLWEVKALIRQHIVGRVLFAGHTFLMGYCGWVAFMLQVGGRWDAASPLFGFVVVHNTTATRSVRVSSPPCFVMQHKQGTG
jgi:hypothetical protein